VPAARLDLDDHGGPGRRRTAEKQVEAAAHDHGATRQRGPHGLLDPGPPARVDLRPEAGQGVDPGADVARQGGAAAAIGEVPVDGRISAGGQVVEAIDGSANWEVILEFSETCGAE
jgi:hypothetical protein